MDSAASNPTIVDNQVLTVLPGEASPATFNPEFGETTVVPYYVPKHATVKIDLISTTDRSVVATLQPAVAKPAAQ